MDENDRQRYVRWQDYRIKQLSFSINMLLGLAVASLGFAINMGLENKAPLLVITGPILLWATSVFSGCIATFSRLVDFRHTARKIKDNGDNNALIAKWAGRVTWTAFWTQTITYLAGACVFVFVLVGFMIGRSTQGPT